MCRQNDTKYKERREKNEMLNILDRNNKIKRN